MADVSIDSSISTSAARGMRAVVFTTASIGYWFYIDSAGTFVYSKTTDGGGTWGAAVTIATPTTHIAYDVWFDQWTPGDTGTLIHLWYFDVTGDDVTWRSLDTNGDTLGTARILFAGATAVAGRGAFVSGTKTRSGYLYCAYDIDAGAERGLQRSTDGGTTWSANLSTTFVEATLDEVSLFPASGTGDNNDCWAIYVDASTAELTYKMWDSSAAAAIESSAAHYIPQATDLTGQFGYSGSVRHSDGALFVSFQAEYQTAAIGDQHINHLVTWGGSNFTVTAKAVLSAVFNQDHYYPRVFIDQTTDNIYVAYNGKKDASEAIGATTKVYYDVSTDGGTTWSGGITGDTAYMEGAAGAVVQVWAPISGPRFYVGWRVGTTLVGNAVNSLTFAAGGAGLATPALGVATWAGLAATVLTPRLILPAVGLADWAGFAPTIATPLNARPGVGLGTWAGLAPTVVISQNAIAATSTGAVVWDGFAPTAVTPAHASTDVGAATWAGFAPTVIGGQGTTKTPGTGSVDWVGLAATILTPTAAQPDVGVGTWTGIAPLIKTPLLVTPDVGTATWTGLAATVLTPRLITPAVGAATWTGLAPTISAGTSVAPGVGIGTWSGLAPTVVVTQAALVQPGVGQTTWAGLAPSIPRTASTATGVGTWTGLAPTFATSNNRVVTPALGQATWTGFAPLVVTPFSTVTDTGILSWSGLEPSVSIRAPGRDLTLCMEITSAPRLAALTVSDARYEAEILSAARWDAVSESQPTNEADVGASYCFQEA